MNAKASPMDANAKGVDVLAVMERDAQTCAEHLDDDLATSWLETSDAARAAVAELIAAARECTKATVLRGSPKRARILAALAACGVNP
jgi:hypothetical protein